MSQQDTVSGQQNDPWSETGHNQKPVGNGQDCYPRFRFRFRVHAHPWTTLSFEPSYQNKSGTEFVQDDYYMILGG